MNERTKKFISKSEKDTAKFAVQFAHTLKGGEIVLLEGDLGSGKTTFVRGLARAFGVHEPVRSPTFTLLHVHKVKNKKSKIKNLIHIDAYRLKDFNDLISIGIEEYIGRADTVVFIEWGEKFKKNFKDQTIMVILMGYGSKINNRIIKIQKYEKSRRYA